MAKQSVNLGSAPNDGTGDTLRAGGDKINDNFAELYTALGDGSALNVAAAVAATAAVTANSAKVSNAAHTGDVTGATTLTIADNAVTNAKAADMATATIKGRVTAGTGDPEDMSVSQAKTLLNYVAADISISDTGSLITATEVEGALQELAAVKGTFGAGTPTATAKTPDAVNQYYWDTLNSRLYIAEGTSAPSDFVATNTAADAVIVTTSVEDAGSVLGGTVASPSLADSDVAATFPLIGVVDGDGNVVSHGLAGGIDTSGFSAGAVLYVSSTAGALTATPPTTGTVAQVGHVNVVDAASGSIMVDLKISGSATAIQEIWIPAQAFTAKSTGGPEAATVDYGTSGASRSVLAFASDATELAFLDWAPPKSWNEGTITFIPVWSHPAATTNFGVVWRLRARAFSNDDAIDTAFSASVTSTDTGGTTNDLYIGPESSSLTIDGTPAEGDMVGLELARVHDNGSDTMAVDARLHGIKVRFTRDEGSDE